MKKLFLLAGLVSVIGLATVNAPSDKTGKGGFTSPTTTKGDLIVRNSSTDTRVGVGADGLVLTADSAQATGVKWASVAGTGDVVGPASAADNGVCTYNGTTGKAIQDNSGVTLGDTGIFSIPSTGGLGIGATATSTNVVNVRKDQNAVTRSILSNQNTGSSAVSRLSVSTDAGDVNLDVTSSAGGALANLAIDSTFTGGFSISQAGANPIKLLTNGADAFSITGAGNSRVHGKLGIGGAAASDTALYLSKPSLSGSSQYGLYADTTFSSAATSGAYGFSTNFGTEAAAYTVPFLLNYSAGGIVKGAGSTITRAVGYYGVIETAATNNALLADNVSFTGDYFFNSTSARPSLLSGTLTLSVTASDSAVFQKSDNSPSVKFEGGSNDYYLGISSGEFILWNNGVTAISKCNQSGKCTLGSSGGSQTHDINGGFSATGNGSVGGTLAVTGASTLTGAVTNSALTASRVVVSDASKVLTSSTMSQTLLESLTTEQIDGMIETPSDKTYILRLNAKYAVTVNNISIKTASGTITAKLQIDGVDVTGCTAIAVTSTEGTTNCTAANSAAAGATITLVTSSNSSATDLQFSVQATRN